MPNISSFQGFWVILCFLFYILNMGSSKLCWEIGAIQYLIFSWLAKQNKIISIIIKELSCSLKILHFPEKKINKIVTFFILQM